MNEKREPARVLDWIASEPWAITQAGLDQIVAIASRQSDIEAVEAKLGKPLENTRAVTVRNGVATIPVTGPIFRYANMFTRISGATAIQDLAADFTAAEENPDVRAIVLSIDSPGGTVNGVGEFARMVKASKTPVTAYIGNMAASAAFWIAAAADERVAFDAALIGSVGAVLGVSIPPKPKDGGERHMEFVSSVSPKKRVDIESDAGKAQIQQWVDDTGDVFVSEVAAMMGMKVEDVVAQFGQGDILIAAKAKDAGMVNRIATYEEVIAELSAKTAKGNVVRPRFAAKSKEKLMNDDVNPNATGDDLAVKMEALQKQNEELSALLQSEKAERVKAEAEKLTAEANAKVDGWEREGRITGNATAEVRKVYVAAKTGLAITADQVEAMVSALPKLSTTRFSADTKPPADTGDVTLSDFAAAAQDLTAAKKIKAVVTERRKADPKFTQAMLERELQAASGH